MDGNNSKNLVESCIESLKRAGTISNSINIQPDTVVLGKDSNFDSIGFITLITDIENKLEQNLGREVYIVLDEIDGFNANNPSLTISSLIEYIKKIS
jgi:acyl carrier protein